MRNLKKILALVLALIMSLSLMTVAGAAETASADGAELYATAKTVLTGLKVFEGDEGTGAMRWDNNVKRSEAAATLYRIATGDVAKTQVGLYSNTNFTDGVTGHWAEGYIAYCYNAEIVKGVNTEQTLFDPDGYVTGYQVLAMALRTLGYGKNGEFEGDSWVVQTAATAKREGLLNGITAADEAALGQPARRELIAQILFNTLLQETVNFDVRLPNLYPKTGTTLGYKVFTLEEVTGVVVANEYANLYGTSTIKEETTRLRENGVDYTLTDVSTDLDDIGESKLAYVVGKTKALAIDDSGLNSREVSTAKETSLSAIETKAGISGATGAEHFINFAKGTDRYSDYKIQYILKYDTQAKAETAANKINRAAGTSIEEKKDGSYWVVTRAIAPKNTVTGVDLSYIEEIFGKADRTKETDKTTIVTGEVYVGSQSYVDISDVTSENLKYSYDRFYNEFIKVDEDVTVSGNERGNWLKVIDNNGDGKTDYVLKVIYTLAQVTDAKDGKATALDVMNHTLDNSGKPCAGDALNNVTGQSIVSADTLETNDIVYYALIDGKIQAYKAPMKTVTFNDVHRNTYTAVTTDGEEMVESGVHEHIADEAYLSGVTNIAGKVSYNVYLDRGGYLAAFVQTEAAGQFKLITDGWYNSVKVGSDYAVKVYNDETGAQDTVDVPSNGSLFVGNVTLSNVQNNGWGALKYLGGVKGPNALTYASYAALNGSNAHKDTAKDTWVSGNQVRTTVAAFANDNSILPVEDASVASRYEHAMIDLSQAGGGSVIPTSSSVKGTVYTTSVGSDTAYDKIGTSVELRALSTTVYYLVYPASGSTYNYQVTRLVGYANAPNVAAFAKNGWVEDIYAVGTRHETGNTITNAANVFYTADVVVIELNAYDDPNELILVVDDEARLTNVDYRNLTVIRANGTMEPITVKTNGYAGNKAGDKAVIPGLYWLYKTDEEGIYTISGTDGTTPLSHDAIAKSGHIVTGQVQQWQHTGSYDYLVLRSYNSENLPTIVANRGKYYSSSWVNSNIASKEYTINADIPTYTLDYDISRTADYKTDCKSVSLTPVSHAKALAEQVDIVPYGNDNYADRESRDVDNMNGYNMNDVMVFFNGSKAVYAVSFANIHKEGKGDGSTWDFAQKVWENVLPSKTAASPTTAPVVELGYKLGTEFRPVAVLTPRSSGQQNIYYSDWKAAEGREICIRVRPAENKNNEIMVENGTGTWGDVAVFVSPVVDTGSGKIGNPGTGHINVQSRGKNNSAVSQNFYYAYTFVAASSDAGLQYAKTEGALTTKYPATANSSTDDLTKPANRSLESFIKGFFQIHEKATAEFHFVDALNGKTITVPVKWEGGELKPDLSAVPAGYDTSNVKDGFTVVVKAEDGTVKIYPFKQASGAPAVVTVSLAFSAVSLQQYEDAAGEIKTISLYKKGTGTYVAVDGKVTIPVEDITGAADLGAGWTVRYSYEGDVEAKYALLPESGNIGPISVPADNKVWLKYTQTAEEPTSAMVTTDNISEDVKADEIVFEAPEENSKGTPLSARSAATEWGVGSPVQAVFAVLKSVVERTPEKVVFSVYGKAVPVYRYIGTRVENTDPDYVLCTAFFELETETAEVDINTNGVATAAPVDVTVDLDNEKAATVTYTTGTIYVGQTIDITVEAKDDYTLNSVAVGDSGNLVKDQATSKKVTYKLEDAPAAVTITVTTESTLPAPDVTVTKARIGAFASDALDEMMTYQVSDNVNQGGTITIGTDAAKGNMRLHKNGAGAYGAWVGFEVAVNDLETKEWDTLWYIWQGRAKKSLDLTAADADLGDSKKGIAFYYDLDTFTESEDTVTVWFTKGAGDSAVTSREVEWTVKFVNAKAADHKLTWLKKGETTYDAAWWSALGVDIDLTYDEPAKAVSGGSIECVIDVDTLNSKIGTNGTASDEIKNLFPTTGTSDTDLVHYDSSNGASYYLCIPFVVDVVSDANGAKWADASTPNQAGFDDPYGTNGVITNIRVAKWDANSSKWMIVDNNLATGTTGKSWEYVLTFTSSWSGNQNAGTPVSGAPTAAWTFRSSLKQAAAEVQEVVD